MTIYPCDSCPRDGGKCDGINCRRWEMWFREHWAYINAMARAYHIQPTTPPTEEVNELEDEGTEEADS